MCVYNRTSKKKNFNQIFDITYIPQRQCKTQQTGKSEKKGQTHKDRTLPLDPCSNVTKLSPIERRVTVEHLLVIHKHLQPPPAIVSPLINQNKKQNRTAEMLKTSRHRTSVCSAVTETTGLRLCLRQCMCDCHPDWFLE